MSNQQDQGRYFKCPSFAITMPVSECKRRRQATDKIKPVANEIGGELVLSNRHMTKQCANCEVFREVTADENTITHEQMMAYLNSNPSQEQSTENKRAMHFGSLRTPHKDYGR